MGAEISGERNNGQKRVMLIIYIRGLRNGAKGRNILSP